MSPLPFFTLAALLACTPLASVEAATVLSVDASAPVPGPEEGYLRLGSNVSPSGVRLEANSRFLSLDGRPWLPVMGEFHYSRVPADEWDAELSRMKLAGVDVVSTYVIWSHHQPRPGPLDWSGDRDLRRFVTLAARHGLKVLVRLGPWVHAEVRYGGIPEWVVQSARTRSDDPAYLADVDGLYRGIGDQLRGLLWKDGGPVIGVQIENEYNLVGPGQGRGHIATLKAMALKAGLDVPLYTVTGWDKTVYPAREVAPVFGGYPDLPWSASRETLPPSETYAFRFGSRVAGDLGAQTAGGANGDADADAAHTPYLTAEYGAGMGPFYRRRTWTTAEDGAALLPVQLGSGVNMFGYYMFQGGRNPQQPGGWQESTATGGYNDLPLVNYDLSAPLGEYGQENPVFRAVRPFHLFLQAFGDRLAPMSVYKPDVVPASSTDLTTARFAVRAAGDRGFLFYNSHIRQHHMAAQRNVQFRVRLAGRTAIIPERPIDLPQDASFIWPIGMDLDGVRLEWSTAQPLTRIADPAGPTYVFAAIAGVEPAFAFPADVRLGAGDAVRRAGADASGVGVIRVRRPDRPQRFTVAGPDRRQVSILLLPPAMARDAAPVQLQGQTRLVVTAAELVSDQGGRLTLRSVGDNHPTLSVFPAAGLKPSRDSAFHTARGVAPFAAFTADLPARAIPVSVVQSAQAQPAPPVRIGGAAGAAVEPVPEAFGASAAWKVRLDPGALDGLADAYLDIGYVGDEARILSEGRLLDDQFYDGRSWRIGLKRHAASLASALTLRIMPLRRDSPVYLQPEAVPKWAAGETQRAEVTSIKVTPVYDAAFVPQADGSVRTARR